MENTQYIMLSKKTPRTLSENIHRNTHQTHRHLDTTKNIESLSESERLERDFTFVFPFVSRISNTCRVIPKLTKFLKSVIHKNASTDMARWASMMYVPVAVAPMIN